MLVLRKYPPVAGLETGDLYGMFPQLVSESGPGLGTEQILLYLIYQPNENYCQVLIANIIYDFLETAPYNRQALYCPLCDSAVCETAFVQRMPITTANRQKIQDRIITFCCYRISATFDTLVDHPLFTLKVYSSQACLVKLSQPLIEQI